MDYENVSNLARTAGVADLLCVSPPISFPISCQSTLLYTRGEVPKNKDETDQEVRVLVSLFPPPLPVPKSIYAPFK